MTKVGPYRQYVCVDNGHEGSERSMNLFVEALTKTQEAYAQYENKMAWLYKFLDSLTITGTNVDAGSVRETLKMHVIYYIQGVETFEDFKQWVLPLGIGNLLDDKWWDEQMKVFENGQ